MKSRFNYFYDYFQLIFTALLFFQIPTKNHHRSASVPRELICIKGATLAAMPIEAEQLESVGHLRVEVDVVRRRSHALYDSVVYVVEK